MSEDHAKVQSALTRLRTGWSLTALGCLIMLGGGYIFLSSQWGPSYATRWLVISSIICIYLSWSLWQGLEYNYRPGEEHLLATFGPGNNLTILRALMIAAVAGFLTSPRPEGLLAWIPGVLYTLAALIDLFDGYVARLTNHTTHLGGMLDIRFDGLGVLVAALLIVQYGQVPAWYLLVALARYIFLAGIWLRVRLGKPVHDLPPSRSRRPLAGVQMGFMAVVLWPLFSPPATYLAATLFAIPFLVGFTRDWFLVSGVIKPTWKTREVSELSSSRFRRRARDWLPIGLRLAVVVLMAGPLIGRLLDYTNQVTRYAELGMPYPPIGLAILSLFEVCVMLLIFLGAGGRASAIVALGLLGIHQIFAPLTPAQVTLVIFLTAIMYLGTGVYSLWTPENHLIYRRLGEQTS
jgi:CDP-diacylglycerol--glycerol-3-phosphate 3-phosphatidyltransferase